MNIDEALIEGAFLFWSRRSQKMAGSGWIFILGDHRSNSKCQIFVLKSSWTGSGRVLPVVLSSHNKCWTMSIGRVG
eukprot:scaffold69770_cov46-Attheya_sp.AAC.5